MDAEAVVGTMSQNERCMLEEKKVNGWHLVEKLYR